MSFNYQSYFERRQGVCCCELSIKGTRGTVRTLLVSLAKDAGVKEILADFPTVPMEAMRAVISLAEEDLPGPPVPVAA